VTLSDHINTQFDPAPRPTWWWSRTRPPPASWQPGYALWVWSIRSGEGVIPTADEARTHVWTEPERELVADRVDTQLVGSPAQVADQLEILRDAPGAGELITTITHDHADRVRSYRLMAQESGRR
jgi:alkanesulfonate monooxygenase SsuD/methylene tetrahydromethanopterin reductase-like flavin-dependent oxidoreductase (luciferase family)